jgi:ubiquinol-cytochrome c reductase cytochrome b subunit
MRILRSIGGFFYDRLGLERIVDFVIRHPVPRGNAEGKKAWMYVLGIATLTAFMVQVVTGIALATKYIPSPAHAYQSLIYINTEVWGGSLLRGMHYFGASAMVLLITLHAARVFLTGSYKYPRELNWVFGVVLLVLTLMMAATGQLLRWDQHGLWTVTLASQLVGRTPLLGPQLAEFVLAGDAVGGATLSRFFVIHVLILPLMIFLVIGVHMYLVLHHGVSEPPEAGRPVDPKTYRAWYKRHSEESGYQYFPDAAWREAVAAFVVVAAVVVLALVFGPKGPDAPPDPTAMPTDPRPDWYFRWYYALLYVKPPGWETLFTVYLPLLVLFGLLALPFVRNTGERHPKRRPWAVIAVALAVLFFGLLTEVGMRAPWAMKFDAGPLPREIVGDADGPAWHGAQLFQERGCLYCHRVEEYGGTFGPDLTRALQRMPPEHFVDRTINGVRDMPAYRDVLNSEEMAAIIAFLRAVAERQEYP